MDSPALEWTLTATSIGTLALLNTMSAAMPLATWRQRSLIRAREGLARSPHSRSRNGYSSSICATMTV